MLNSGYDSDFLGETSSATEKVNPAESFNWTQNIMNPLKWNFLSEPAYKWATFFVMVSFFMVAWKGVLRVMK